MGFFKDLLGIQTAEERMQALERECERECQESEERFQKWSEELHAAFRNFEFPPDEEGITWKYVDYHGDHPVHIKPPQQG
jgi:hypothetical protein